MRNKHVSNLGSVMKRFGAITMAMCVTASMGCFNQELVRASTEQIFSETKNYQYIEVVANGDEKYAYYTVVRANLGETTELSVTVTAEDMEGITYEWYYTENGEDIILESTTDKCVTKKIEKMTYYSCRVTDRYGTTCEATFQVQVENHLKYSLNDRGTAPCIYVDYGEDADLYLTVTADNMEGMSYSWWKCGDAFEGDKLLSTTDKCTISNVTSPGGYGYMIQDCYGNITNIHFGIDIDNHLKIYASGEIDRVLHKNVKQGEDVQISVQVSADNMQDLKYEWYHLGDNNYYEKIGNTLDTYTIKDIQKYETYYCEATDCYGNTTTAWFYIGIENHLEAYANGEMTNFSKNIAQGDSIELSVTATADNTQDLKYEWYYRNDDTGYYCMTDNTSPKLVVNNVQKYSSYWCVVTDCFGNKKNAWFSVGVENHLKVSANGEDNWCYYKDLNRGESIELLVKAEADNMQGITYNWYYETDKGSQQLTNTSDSLTINNIQKYGKYECVVTDCYGNSETAYFCIGIENHLCVYANGDQDSTKIYIEAGGNAEMNVTVSADVDKDTKYAWFYSDGENRGYVACTDSHYSITDVKRATFCHCEVTDCYGNKKTVFFSIYVN